MGTSTKYSWVFQPRLTMATIWLVFLDSELNLTHGANNSRVSPCLAVPVRPSHRTTASKLNQLAGRQQSRFFLSALLRLPLSPRLRTVYITFLCGHRLIPICSTGPVRFSLSPDKPPFLSYPAPKMSTTADISSLFSQTVGRT